MFTVRYTIHFILVHSTFITLRDGILVHLVCLYQLVLLKRVECIVFIFRTVCSHPLCQQGWESFACCCVIRMHFIILSLCVYGCKLFGLACVFTHPQCTHYLFVCMLVPRLWRLRGICLFMGLCRFVGILPQVPIISMCQSVEAVCIQTNLS